MNKFLFSILFSLFFLNLSAQYEAAHWFFGDHAGLNFTSGAPVVEPGSQINTEEGCSSISNACGDLLLYTDGVTVWNANHQVMLNGTSLKGDASSTQSGIVVPNPTNDNIYYIFTVDEAFSQPSYEGLQYSVVDMSLDGGLGGIVSGQKNIKLVDSASEKVTAVISSDGSSVWVITLAPPTSSTMAPYTTIGSNMNTFYAFKVDGNGVSNTATISTLGLNISGGLGYMKAAPNGKKIAIANSSNDDRSAFLLDFDDVTGAVRNPVALPLNMDNNHPYGVEFSPDSSKLYLSDWYNRLTQFDLTNNNQAIIISTDSNYRAALQLGLDGKIYRPYTKGYRQGSNFISVIENPNKPGLACNYRHRLISLGGGMEVHQGLPPFIQSYFVQVGGKEATIDFLNNYEVESNEEILSVDWDFGDGTTTTTLPDNAPDNTHAQTSHTYTNPGTYTITAVLHLAFGCSVTATKTVEAFPIIDSKLTTFCTDNHPAIETIDLHIFDDVIAGQQGTQGDFAVAYYLTNNDALTETNPITTPYTNNSASDQLYYAATNTNTGNTVYGTFYLNLKNRPETEIISDYEICDTDTDGFAEFDLTSKIPEILGNRAAEDYDITFYTSQVDAESSINEIPNPENYINLIAFNDSVWYQIMDISSGCTNEAPIDLIIYPLINIDMPSEYMFCLGHSIEINAPAGFTTYEWSTGDVIPDLTVSMPGQYTLTVTNNFGCSNTKIVNVTASDVAQIDKIEIHDFSPQNNNQIIVQTSGIGNYEFSLDDMNYQDENIFNGLSPGTYMVYVSDKNTCGKVTQEVSILGAPQFFTPNGDGHNDNWQIVNISKYPSAIVSIYDRFGRLIKVLSANNQGWDGTLNGLQLPSDDYWFSVTLKDPSGNARVVKGHFTLKR